MNYGIIVLVTLVGVFKHYIMLLLSLYLCGGEIREKGYVIFTWSILLSLIEGVIIGGPLNAPVFIMQLLRFLLYGFVIYRYSQKTFFFGLSMSFIVKTFKLPVAILGTVIGEYLHLSAYSTRLLTAVLIIVVMFVWLKLLKNSRIGKTRHLLHRINAGIYTYINCFYIGIVVVIPYFVSVITRNSLGYFYFGTVFNLTLTVMLIMFIFVYIGAQYNYKTKSKVIKSFLSSHGKFLEAYDHFISKKGSMTLSSEMLMELNKINQPYLKSVLFERISKALLAESEITLKLISCDKLNARADFLIEYIDYAISTATGNIEIEMQKQKQYKLLVRSTELLETRTVLSRNNEIMYKVENIEEGYLQVIKFT